MTDSVQVQTSLEEIIDYNWKDELRNFEEVYEVEVHSPVSLVLWIDRYHKEKWTSHIFYHLMILRSYLNLCKASD